MKASELRELTIDDLKQKLLELRKTMFTYGLQRAAGTLDKFHVIGQTRKNIARVKTVITQKQREVANG